LAVHPLGRGAVAGEVVALAEVVEEVEDDEEDEEELEVTVVVAEEVADEDALDDAEEDLDDDAELDDEELAEAEGTVAPAGPVNIVRRFAPPQVCPALPAQGVLHWVEAATLPALIEFPQ